jgi:hypothetical protein
LINFFFFQAELVNFSQRALGNRPARKSWLFLPWIFPLFPDRTNEASLIQELIPGLVVKLGVPEQVPLNQKPTFNFHKPSISLSVN